MSCFTKKVGEDEYYCIDDYFGHHRYGYVKMTQHEATSESPWELLQYAELKGRGGVRQVLNEEEFFITSLVHVTAHTMTPDEELRNKAETVLINLSDRRIDIPDEFREEIIQEIMEAIC